MPVTVGRVTVPLLEQADFDEVLPLVSERVTDDEMKRILAILAVEDFQDLSPSEARQECLDLYLDGCVGLRYMTSDELRLSFVEQLAGYREQQELDGTPLSVMLFAFLQSMVGRDID